MTDIVIMTVSEKLITFILTETVIDKEKLLLQMAHLQKCHTIVTFVVYYINKGFFV